LLTSGFDTLLADRIIRERGNIFVIRMADG